MSEKAEYSTTDPPPLIFIAVAQTTMSWEEETGVEIPASKSTLLRGHESEVFICA
ncbi:hypothetical protein DAPPUDRAFT_260541 [Daphnia pulex]|uniref:Uncharacterized protein n=1 Tax=Daphnia pulex TaxID=6669 RepID=E9HJE4_DAPPU|nr:hypothetical protein DAPPUDRAFT_260541 [Daphnia pulex]|eukprot:EFX68155.1 hypothetical protein DAPPUDRAFT_260541 [Daphnia pulex]